MQTGKVTVVLAIITIIGGWGTALITNWSSIFPESKASSTETQVKPIEKIKKNLEIKVKELKALEITLSKVEMEIEIEKNKTKKQKEIVILKDKEIDDLKRPFHRISNKKLKQLLLFHNDAVCYGRSLNFTHPSDVIYSHCVSKDILAKRFLRFFEELGIINSNIGVDYSRKKAKDELIKLQSKYKFTDLGWYTELMLGILIIEYAKKA